MATQVRRTTTRLHIHPQLTPGQCQAVHRSHQGRILIPQVQHIHPQRRRNTPQTAQPGRTRRNQNTQVHRRQVRDTRIGHRPILQRHQREFRQRKHAQGTQKVDQRTGDVQTWRQGYLIKSHPGATAGEIIQDQFQEGHRGQVQGHRDTDHV